MMNSAYIAGIFDGEGTVGLYAYKHRLPSPILAISGSCLALMEALRNHFGFGFVFGYSPGRFQPEMHRTKQMYRWQVRRWSHILSVLAEIRPYLIEKASQADLMFEANRLRPGKGRKLTPEARQRFMQMEFKIKAAKRADSNPT